MSETVGKREGKRNTLLKSIRNIFLKASVSLSIAASRLRSLADEVLSSDEVVNELFLVSSSSSIDASLLENTEVATTTNNNNNQTETQEDSFSNSTGSRMRHQTSPLVPPYSEFDAMAEADALRKDDGTPFTEGAVVWQRRREAWLKATPEQRHAAKQKAKESVLNQVPKDSYPVVYYNLVDKQKTLKRPLNLKDAIKVINAGWVNNGNWERATRGGP